MLSRWAVQLPIVLGALLFPVAKADVALPSSTTNLLFTRMSLNSSDVWVSGTRAEAIIEYKYPALSVFSPSYTTASLRITPPTSTNSIIASWWTQRAAGDVQFATIAGGAAADPASLGVAWVLAQLSATGDLKASYKLALDQEIAYLLQTVPRSSTGAMSMRPPSEAVQLWSDFICELSCLKAEVLLLKKGLQDMVPPYLAYYGVVTKNVTLIQLAFNQIGLYRTTLRDRSTGLWQHVLLGSFQDTGVWGTGNAWAASGMTRVLATIQNSPFASSFTSQSNDLSTWINSILSLTFANIRSDNLLPNYYKVAADYTFSDAASSALLASCAYRMDSMKRLTAPANIAVAERIRVAIYPKIDTSTGWVATCVNPLSWQLQVNESPESVAFVVLMQAAWRDWRAAS